MEWRPPAGPPALRASDADRESVVEALRTACADGRLTPAELDQRLDGAFAARTVGELRALVRDLPGGTPPDPVTQFLGIGQRAVETGLGIARLAIVWTLLTPILVTLAVAVGVVVGGTTGVAAAAAVIFVGLVGARFVLGRGRRRVRGPKRSRR